MEFIIGNNNYKYGMFHQESNGKYYITDETIDLIINNINWKKSAIEQEYLQSWRSFEKIHRQFCLNEISREIYEKLIEEEYDNFESRTNFEFGENVDELINHIIRCLEG